jgi:hypothetical protein
VKYHCEIDDEEYQKVGMAAAGVKVTTPTE